jgi:hypothetical protein
MNFPNKSFHAILVSCLHITFYKLATFSELITEVLNVDAEIVSSSYYKSSVTWTVVCLTAAKFKPLIFPASGFALSNGAIICIFMILYDFCLLPAQFCYIIVYIQPMCTLENFQWRGELCFAGAAILRGECQLQIPRRGKHKSLLI